MMSEFLDSNHKFYALIHGQLGYAGYQDYDFVFYTNKESSRKCTISLAVGIAGLFCQELLSYYYYCFYCYYYHYYYYYYYYYYFYFFFIYPRY